jgi:hypothetical protein
MTVARQSNQQYNFQNYVRNYLNLDNNDMASTARAVIEVTLSWLFANAKGRDAKSFYTRPALASFTEQTIAVTSPDCGPSGSKFTIDYTHDGDGKFPALQWSAPPEVVTAVKEWLLVSEDPDAPLPTPIVHG